MEKLGKYFFPTLCFHQTNHIKSRLQVMPRSRCTPLLVLNAQCSFIAPSFLGSFRITELIVVDSTSGSPAFIEASCLRSTRITTNTQAVPVISSKHGISKLHSQGDVYNNNCCNAIRSSLACSPYLSNTAPLQAISQLFINGEEHFERKERQIRHQPRQWKAQESPKRRDWQRDSKFRSLSTCTSLRRSDKTGKNHLEGAEFVD